MKNNKKAYVFFDIDGTLLPEGKNEIPQNTVLAIKKLKENGHIPFICTGRCFKQAEKFINQLNIENYITSNGEEASVDGEIIYDFNMQEEEIEHLKKIFKNHNITWGYENRERIYLVKEQKTEYVQKVLEGYGIQDIMITNEETAEDIKQMWVFGEKEKLDEIGKEVEKTHKFFRWSDASMEILSPTESKGKAVKKVLNHMNEDVDTYAFGDGYNDIELLKTVDNGVAMGNGKVEVKEIADFVTAECEEDGITKGLKFLKLIE